MITYVSPRNIPTNREQVKSLSRYCAWRKVLGDSPFAQTISHNIARCIRPLDQVVKMSDEALLKLPGIGPKSIEMIRKFNTQMDFDEWCLTYCRAHSYFGNKYNRGGNQSVLRG